MRIVQIGDTYINLERVDFIQADDRNERYDLYIGGQSRPVQVKMGSRDWNRLLEMMIQHNDSA